MMRSKAYHGRGRRFLPRRCLAVDQNRSRTMSKLVKGSTTDRDGRFANGARPRVRRQHVEKEAVHAAGEEEDQRTHCAKLAFPGFSAASALGEMRRLFGRLPLAIHDTQLLG